MTTITTNVKHRIRTTGLNIISDPDQNLGFTCIFSPGMQEYESLSWTKGVDTKIYTLGSMASLVLSDAEQLP